MERLTYWNEEYGCWSYHCGSGEAANRLAAYEETGLSPQACAEAREAGKVLSSCDISFRRLAELLTADRAGRLVVLPSNKTLTNADRMRTATNQQLAKQLYDNQKELCRMVYKNLGFEDELNFSEDYSDILAWLNTPSKEAEKALEAKKDE
nr:MAG TPA: hypothetical protein [Caudoviricetes sp.]